MKGKAVGNVKITARTDDGGLTASCDVRVGKEVTGVSLDSESLELTLGQKVTLKASVKPASAAHREVTWESLNPAVASVDSKGAVTANSIGETTVTVTTKSGGYTAYCLVKVVKATLSLNLSSYTLFMETAPTVQLKATVSGAAESVSWNSSNPSVAKVNGSGLVTAVSAGSATITASAAGLEKTCAVTVNPVAYRALLVGNSYTGTSYLGSTPFDLRYMNTALSGLGGATKHTITEKQKLSFSGTNLSSAISSAFAGADANDVSLFYYTGHGSSDGSIVGQDYTDVTPKQLRQMLDGVPGRKVVFVDACHSGRLIGRGAEGDFETAFLAAFAEDGDGALSSRSDSDLDANGYFVITACSGGQVSSDWTHREFSDKPGETREGWASYKGYFEEDGKVYFVNNGVFKEITITGGTGVLTRSLVRSLGYDYAESWTTISPTNLMADANDDSRITFQELFTFTKSDVNAFQSAQDGVAQTTTTNRANAGNVFFAR